MLKNKNIKGMTFVELLLALIITAIILAAASTLAFTIGSANDDTDQAVQSQAQLRYAILRISEIIRNCKMICCVEPDFIGIWGGDYNGDARINLEEAVFIQADSDENVLRILECYDFTYFSHYYYFAPYDFANGFLMSFIGPTNKFRTVDLIHNCTNITFQADIQPPRSKYVEIKFEINEDGNPRTYMINASLRAWADHLLYYGQYIIVESDDDE